jgi:hypothetical protein
VFLFTLGQGFAFGVDARGLVALATLIFLATERLVPAHREAATIFVKLTECSSIAIAKAGVASTRLQDAKLLLLNCLFRSLLLGSGGLSHCSSGTLLFAALSVSSRSAEQGNRTDQQQGRKQVFHVGKKGDELTLKVKR